MVSGTPWLGGPKVRALMVKNGVQRQKHKPLQHPGRLTAVKYVEGQARSHSRVNRMLNVIYAYI